MTTDAEYRRLTLLLADRYRYRTALQQILNVLGPEPAPCGCAGCEAEMAEALRLAEEALDG